MSDQHDEAPGPVSDGDTLLGQLRNLLRRLEKNLAGAYRLLRYRDRQNRYLSQARQAAEKERDEAIEKYQTCRAMYELERKGWVKSNAAWEKDYHALQAILDRVRGIVAQRTGYRRV